MVRRQVLRDTALNWSMSNPVLLEGEQAYETDTGNWKIGNGIVSWNSLPYDNQLDNLQDVQIDTPVNGQGLKYSNGTWINGSIEGVRDHTLLTNIGTKTHAELESELNLKASASDLSNKVNTNDSRLSDTRNPNPHVHAQTDITNLDTTLSAKSDTNHNHSGIYEPYNNNIQSHISATNNPHGVNASQIGAEPANANIQTHISTPHAPASAQANADITKAEIEAKLIGTISTHDHTTLQLGETNTTAYRGDRGKTAYDHSQATGNLHGLTKTDLSLNNVDNTSDLNKPLSTAAIAEHNQYITALSTGLLTGGELSINVNPTKFDISAGSGIVINNYTDPLHPVKTLVTWESQTALDDPYIATVDTSYVCINADGDILVTSDMYTDDDRRDLIVIGWLDHPGPGATEITDARTEPTYNCDLQAQLTDFLENFGAFNIEGNTYSANSGLTIKRSAGRTFDNCANYSVSKKSPNVIVSNAEGPCEFYYYYRDGDGGWVSNEAATTTIDPDHYDDGNGTLVDVTAGYWTIQVVSLYAYTNSNDIQYGQVEYATLEAAKSAIQTAIEINPYNTADTFRGWIVVQQGTNDLTNPAKAEFIPAGKLGLFDVASGGGSGGEVNTASNQGTLGTGLYFQKSGVDLQFKNIHVLSNKLSLTDDTDHHSINLDINESNITHQNLSGAGTNSHSTIDTFIASKGAVNGLASLNESGKIPTTQLPAYVDDIIEVANYAALPVTGDSGVAYITIDTNYAYRWSGTVYVRINEGVALGTTSSTAFRGDYGNTAYNHSQSSHAPSNAQKNSDITKSEIESVLTGGINSHTHSYEPADAAIQTHITSLHAPSDANNYTHPANHPPSIITQDSTNRFVTDTEKSTWNGKQNPATTLAGYGITDAAISTHNHSGVYQPADTDLTNIAALTGTYGLLKKTAENTWSIDTSTYAISTHNHTGVYEPANVNIQSHISSAHLALGESSTTAYVGDKGKTAYDHSQATHAPSDAQKNSDITGAEIEAKLIGTISTHSHTYDQGTNTHAQIDTFISSKGNVNGIASLGADGKVPSGQLPASSGGVSQAIAIALSIALG
jgi:hypothetical protein